MVLIRCGLSVAAAVSASSTFSPGMNAETDFRTNARFVACSRRNGEVDMASKTFRITDIRTLWLLQPARRRAGAPRQRTLQDAADRAAVDLLRCAGHVRRGAGQQERGDAAVLRRLAV